jgi:hypothetical protein
MPKPVTSQEWIKALGQRLDDQARRSALYETYYGGTQLAGVTLMSTVKYQEYFSKMFKAIADNWLPIVVDAVSERLTIQGFRMGAEETAADEEAWKFWQYNGFDAKSQALLNTVLTSGLAFVMVWHSGDSAKPVLLTAEHPCEVYVAIDHETGLRIAGIKRWRDEWTGEERVNLYFPDHLEKWIKPTGMNEHKPLGDQAWIANPIGKVPIVPILNRTSLKRDAYLSEFHDVMSTQDQINKLVMDMLIASEYSAFRQRWVTGIDVPIGEDGKPVKLFDVGVDRMLSVGDPAARFGEFGASDLANYVRGIENRVQSLASRTRTPAHYLLGQSGTFPSGETLNATETGLIAKTKGHMVEYDDPLEEVVSLGFSVLEDKGKASITDAEVIWSDPEYRTESEHVDATVKKLAAGIPYEQIWIDLGYTETQRKRFQIWLSEQAQRDAIKITPVANQGQPENNGAANAPASASVDSGSNLTTTS